MEEVGPASYPTNPAADAVELLLVVIVVKLALLTEVFAEDGPAVLAILGHALSRGTLGAHDLLNILSLEDVGLFGVMAEAATVSLLTARGLKKKTKKKIKEEKKEDYVHFLHVCVCCQR